MLMMTTAQFSLARTRENASRKEKDTIEGMRKQRKPRMAEKSTNEGPLVGEMRKSWQKKLKTPETQSGRSCLWLDTINFQAIKPLP
jgi:hypothetical protein